MRNAFFKAANLLLHAKQCLQTGGRIGCSFKRMDGVLCIEYIASVRRAREKHACYPQAEQT